MLRHSARLDWITTFLAVVEEGGFTAAAERIHLSQSRVSAHIAALERELGAVLFDRRARPIGLTDVGFAFLDYAKAVVESLDRADEAVDHVRGLVRGHLALGTIASTSVAFVPRVLREFGSRHPGVQVDLFEGPTLDLDRALTSGEIQLALRPMQPPPRNELMHALPLWQESLVVVVPPEHPLASEAEPLALGSVAAYPLVMIGRSTEGFGLRYESYDAFERAGLTLRVAFQTDHPPTLVALARAGLGVGVTNYLAAWASDTTGVRVLALDAPDSMRKIGLYWNSGFHLSAAAHALLRLIPTLPMPDGTERLGKAVTVGP